jgi:hypothetical protein
VKILDDPKKTLAALLAGTPLGLDSAAEARARALANDPAAATREAVEGLPEPLVLAVLEAAVKARQPELAMALQDSPARALAKGAKKALYALRSLGVAVPEPAPEPAATAAPPAPPAAETAEALPCILSAPTGTGERALLVVRPIRGGGLEVFQVLVSDERGITQAVVAETNRSAYRRQLRELRQEKPLRASEVTLDEARAVLADSAALNAATGTPLPAGGDEMLRHLDVRPSAGPADLPAPAPEDERLAAQAHALHADPEAQPWLPPESQLKLLAQRFDEVMTSPLQLTPVQKEEQLRGVLRSTAQQFFTPQVRRVWGRRLWHLADFLERTGRPEKAAQARAEGRRMFHNASAGPSRFEEFLFEKVLILSRILQKGEKLPERPGAPMPGLAQAVEGTGGKAPAPAQGPPGERKSPGGLILP